MNDDASTDEALIRGRASRRGSGRLPGRPGFHCVCVCVCVGLHQCVKEKTKSLASRNRKQKPPPPPLGDREVGQAVDERRIEFHIRAQWNALLYGAVHFKKQTARFSLENRVQTSLCSSQSRHKKSKNLFWKHVILQPLGPQHTRRLPLHALRRMGAFITLHFKGFKWRTTL